MRRVGQGRGALYLVRRSVLDGGIEAHPLDAADEQQNDVYEREMRRRGLVPGASNAQEGRR